MEPLLGLPVLQPLWPLKALQLLLRRVGLPVVALLLLLLLLLLQAPQPLGPLLTLLVAMLLHYPPRPMSLLLWLQLLLGLP